MGIAKVCFSINLMKAQKIMGVGAFRWGPFSSPYYRVGVCMKRFIKHSEAARNGFVRSRKGLTFIPTVVAYGQEKQISL